MNKPNTFNRGDQVRIAPDYPDQTLQGRKDMIISRPDKEHPKEYEVILNEWPLRGRPVWIHIDYLQAA